MNKMYNTLIILTLAAALLGGCAKENTPEIQESIPAAGAEDDTLLETTKTEDETLLEMEASALKISFEGTDLEGNTVTSDVLSQTKLTMVNVWATYCNPCLSEMPGLGELGVLAPEKRGTISRLIFKAMLGGVFVSINSALLVSIVSLF